MYKFLLFIPLVSCGCNTLQKCEAERDFLEQQLITLQRSCSTLMQECRSLYEACTGDELPKHEASN